MLVSERVLWFDSDFEYLRITTPWKRTFWTSNNWWVVAMFLFIQEVLFRSPCCFFGGVRFCWLKFKGFHDGTLKKNGIWIWEFIHSPMRVLSKIGVPPNHPMLNRVFHSKPSMFIKTPSGSKPYVSVTMHRWKKRWPLKVWNKSYLGPDHWLQVAWHQMWGECTECMYVIIHRVLVRMAEIRLTTWDVWNPLNNGINYL